MKYKAVVKSPMEIIGMDVKEFIWKAGTTTYNYIREMYDLRGQEIIFQKGFKKTNNYYDYYDEIEGWGWLKSWLKDIRPIKKEIGCKLEECFEKWVKEYFVGNVYLLNKTSDGKYAGYEVFNMWNAYKKGYEQKEREIKHEI